MYNETFCDFKNRNDICVLWLEGESDRHAADVAFAYCKVVDCCSE